MRALHTVCRLLVLVACCMKKLSFANTHYLARNQSIAALDVAKPLADMHAVGIPLFRGAIDKDQITELLSQTESCSWSVSHCFHGQALDCKLPMFNTTKHVAESLLRLVLPSHCRGESSIDDMHFLPVRRFPNGISDSGHVDAGPSWTVLLHLSSGATAFYPEGKLVQVPHAPGDAFAWWNTGQSPEHSVVSSFDEKVVINFGVEVAEQGKCNGVTLTAAGCFDPGPEVMGCYVLLWIPFLCCLGIAFAVLVVTGLVLEWEHWPWYASIPLWLLYLVCCCTKSRDLIETSRRKAHKRQVREKANEMAASQRADHPVGCQEPECEQDEVGGA